MLPSNVGHQVQKGKPKIARVTTFRTISKLLQQSDIREYKDFFLNLPDIVTHNTFMDDNSGITSESYAILLPPRFLATQSQLPHTTTIPRTAAQLTSDKYNSR
jgi:hypothetical protein